MDSLSIVQKILGSNPYPTLVGIGIGIVVSYFFYKKARKRKKPSVSLRSNNLVRNLVSKIESLEMTYAGKKIENLTTTKLLFWNRGNETINWADIPSTIPIKITANDGCEILDIKILFEKNSANQFKVANIESGEYHLVFEFIDKDEGVIIQIIHTGISDKSINISGKVKGVGEIENVFLSSFRDHTPSLIPFSKHMKPRTKLFLGFGLYFVPFPLLLWYAFFFNQNGVNIWLFLVSILVSAFFWGFTYLIIHNRIPKGFDEFDNTEIKSKE